MESEKADQRLSQIGTMWTALFKAHGDQAEEANVARQRILERYGPAIYRYFRGAVHDLNIAEELFQEFALRFVRGAFKSAAPDRGRFRDFLKTTLYHVIVDHHRRQKKRFASLSENSVEPAAPESPPPESDEEFLSLWRNQLMEGAWAGLKRLEEQSGQILYTVLHLRTLHPDLEAPALAEEFTRRLERPVNGAWVRKRLYLAREKFTDLLVEEVAQSLDDSSAQGLDEELLDLGLLEYCRPALDRRRA
jgi:RNA polymerase sigma-70 factor (ECF subfamily)